MSYYTFMKLKDFQGRDIQLLNESWEHIQDGHPEIHLEDIKLTLKDPSEVRECPRQGFVELFYRLKSHAKGKIRFTVVVVKVMSDGNFISTAMTTKSMREGRILYKKGAD